MNFHKRFLKVVLLICLVILLFSFLLPTSTIQTNSTLIHIIQTKKCIPHHVNKKLRCYSNEEINNYSVQSI